MSHKSKRLPLVVGLIVLIVGLPLAIYLSRSPKEVAAWFDNSWGYRQKVVITNATAQTNFQAAITLDTATLITAGKMQSDCADIRLTDVNGLIISDPYWVESCNTSTTKIWIKFPTLQASSTVLYVYYGNVNAESTAGTGSQVFEFFDDFDDSSLNSSIWTATSDDYAVSSGVLRLNVGAVRQTNATAFNFNDGYVAEARVQTYATTNYGGGVLGITSSTTYPSSGNAGSAAEIMLGRNTNATAVYRWVASGSAASWNVSSAVSTFTSANTTWAVFTEKVHSGGVVLQKDYAGDVSVTATWTKNLNRIHLGYSLGTTSTNIQDTGYDWVRIRKYAATDPTSALSSEEKAPVLVSRWKMDEGHNQSIVEPVTRTTQYIEITNRYYSHTGSTYTPTDNSLGLIHFDADKYPNSTVYFEADLTSGHASWDGYAALFTEAGAQVTNSEVTIQSANWYRLRSSALTLTDDTNYTVRTYCQSGWCPVGLKGARLVVVQNSPANLTQTQSNIEIGQSMSTSSATYTPLTFQKVYHYDVSAYSPSPNSYLETFIKAPEPPTIEQHIEIMDQTYTHNLGTYNPTDNSLGLIRWDGTKYPGATVYLEVDHNSGHVNYRSTVALFTEAGAQVSGSEMYVMGGYYRSRSGALTLTNGTNYTIRGKNSNTGWNQVTIKAARLVIIQQDSTKITRTEIPVEVGDYQTNITNTTYAEITNPKYYQYNQDLFTPTVESSQYASFSATLKINDASDSAHIALYNKTNSTLVAEISHTGTTAWTYKVADNIDDDTDWDTTNDDEYVVMVRCNDDNGFGGCSANIANAKIHLNQYAAGGITDLEIPHHQILTVATDADATYTSQNYLTYHNVNINTSQPQFGAADLAYYYESTLKTSAGTGYAQLYDATNGTAITGSEVTTTNTSYERVRSSDIYANLPVFPNYYLPFNFDSQLKNSATNTTTASNSWVLIKVSDLSTSGPATGYVELYNLTDNVAVANSEITSTNNMWSLNTSPAFSLTDNKDYIIRTKTSRAGQYLNLLNAKILNYQSNGSGIYANESIIHMINTPHTDADTTYTDTNHINNFNPEAFNRYTNYFEAGLKTSAGTGYAQLTGITGSELTTTSSIYERVRSADLSFNVPTYSTELNTSLKNSATNTTSAINSWFIVQNNNSVSSGTHDSVGLAHASLVNAPTWKPKTDCPQENCLLFNGTSQYLLIPDQFTPDFVASDSFSFSIWFKTSATTGTLISKFNSSTGTDGGYKLYLSGGNVVAGIDDDSTWGPDDSATSPITYNDNAWHYATMVKTGTTKLELFIDGQLVASDTSLAATGTLANTDRLTMAVDSNGTTGYFAGSLDDASLYPSALTVAQVKRDYAGNATIFKPAQSNLNNYLSLHWKFDDAGTPATDSSGNNNLGTWQDNAAAIAGKFSTAINLDGTNDRVTADTATNIAGTWSRKKTITLTNNTASTLTNYQAYLTITYDSNMQPDFDDLRFTNANGTPLDYYLDSKIDSTTAYVYVEVDSIPASGSTTITMLYGNNNVTSTSSGANTFTFFDDFTGSSVDTSKWTLTNGTGWSVTNGELVGTSTTGQITSTTTFSQPNIFEYKYRYTSNPNNGYMAGGTYLSSSNAFGFDNSPGADYYRTNGTWTSMANVDPANTDLLLTITAKSATQVDLSLKNYSTLASYQTLSNHSNDISSEPIVLGKRYDGSYTGQSYGSYWDWIRVRQYVSSLPTISYGDETAYTPPYTTPLTISAWINADTLGATDRIIFARGNDGAGYSWLIKNDAANPGKIKFSSDGGVNYGTSNSTLTTGSWNYVVLVIEGTSTRLYLNGVLDAAITNNGTIPATGIITCGADDDGGNGWDGMIDEFSIYNRALTLGDITSLYNLSPLVGNWPLDENAGTVAYDRAGSNYHGTLTNGPIWSSGQYGSALTFDGSNDYVDIGAGPTQVNTISFWTKPTTTTEYFLNLTSNTDYIWLNNGTLTATGLASPTYYVNGVPTQTMVAGVWQYVTITTATAENASNLDFGRTQDSNYLEGSLDDIKLYSSVLDSEKITQDFNAGHPAPGSPLNSAYLHYSFNELNGTATHNEGNGGNTLNGIIANGTWTNSGKFQGGLTLGATSSVTTTIADPGATNTLSLWLYPQTSAASKTLVTSGKLTTDSSSRPVYGNCIGTTLPLDTWTHLVAVSNGSGSCTIYQNGNQTASSSQGVTFGTSIDIGGSSYTGTIDEFKLFNFALNSSQVNLLYQQSSAAVMGSVSTESDGVTVSNSAARAYCVPGDTTSCSAPVAYWKMDENSGSTITDAVGVGYTGTLTNNPQWTNGKIGSAVNFDGLDDYVSVPAATNINNLSAFTIEAWIKPSTAGASGSRIIAKGPLRFWIDNNRTLALTRYRGGGTTNALIQTYADAINFNEWTHVVGVFDSGSSQIDLYLNGAPYLNPETDDPGSGTLDTDAADDLYIGNSSGTDRDFTGGIDDLKIYNYARTPAQIAWDYNQGKALVNYDFNECTGSTLHNYKSTTYPGTITIGATGTYTAAGSCSSSVAAEAWNAGTTGKYNSSLAFDGTDDYVDVGTGPTQVNSVSFWINPTTTTEYPVDLNGTAYIWVNSGTVTAQGFSSPTIYINGRLGSTLTAGSWQHVVVTTATALDASDLDLGRIEGVGYLEGLLDNVQIYTYPLTPTQVKTIYNANSAVRFE